MPSAAALAELVEMFSVLGEATRLKIVVALSATDELCVSDLSRLVKMNIPTISMQLRLLHGLGVVSRRQQGRMSFYALRNQVVRELVDHALASATRRK